MVSATKLRHAGNSGYARGEETRARIIAAALKMFGERGFDGASTRDIASAAGVNAPALQYYFNNKEGAYIACAEHIVTLVRSVLDEVLLAGQKTLDEQGDDEALIAAFCAIQKQFIRLMLPATEAEGARQFMAREHAGLAPTLGTDILYQRMSKPIMDVTTAIIGRLLGKAASDDETIIRTATLTGQGMGLFNIMGGNSLSKMDWIAPDMQRLQMIEQIVSEHTIILLRAIAASRDRHGQGAPK